jgi:RNA polymerase sigma-70 factor, ECF subfamily
MAVEELITAIAARDHSSFVSLYNSQQPLMCRYANGLVAGDTDVAQDIVDEAFLEVWRSAGTFSGAGSGQGWIRRIVRNKAIDWLRKQKERPVSNESEAITLVRMADGQDGPDRIAEKNCAANELRACLERLSPEHREAVWLCYFEELPLSEIATIMGCPENTVKTRLYHARKNLKSMLTVDMP